MSCKFRSACAYDPRLRDGMRCPTCQWIDWRRDGLTVTEADDRASIVVEGLDLRQVRGGDWRCARCGYAAAESSRPSRLLARAVIESRFAVVD